MWIFHNTQQVKKARMSKAIYRLKCCPVVTVKVTLLAMCRIIILWDTQLTVAIKNVQIIYKNMICTQLSILSLTFQPMDIV